MQVVNVSQFENTLVLYFETEGHSVNAYTLASTLVSIADAAKAANDSINYGHEIEIVVEVFGDGSFRAKIKAIYTKSRDIFSDVVVPTVILGLIVNYIYDRTLSVDNLQTIIINTDEVIIERGDDRVIVPRTVYDATRVAEKNPQFVHAMSKTLYTLGNDESISAFGFSPNMDSPKPEILATKTIMQKAALSTLEEPATRTVKEHCRLQILKAILENSRRKWEFVWRGEKISAPIIDGKFFAQFIAHEITIAPGDELDVELTLKQSIDEKTGVYTNVGFIVTEVFEHHTGIKQTPLDNEYEK